MERTSTKLREEFRTKLAEEFHYTPLRETGNTPLSRNEVVAIADCLMRHGATYGRLQEDSCNIPMDDRQQAAHDRREANVEKWITKLCERLGCTPDFSGDPRGNTIKLVVPSGRTDDWGRTGICVPTS